MKTNNYGMNDGQFDALMTMYQELIDNMPINTEIQRERKANAQKHLNNAYNDCGAFGRVREIISTDAKNNIKKNVSAQRKTDNYIIVNGRQRRTEIKTNQGRLEMLKADGTLYKAYYNDYIIYSIDLCNSGTNYQHRQTNTRLFTMIEFINLLYGF